MTHSSCTIRLGFPEEVELFIAIDDDASRLYTEAGVPLNVSNESPLAREERVRWVGIAERGGAFIADTPALAGAGFAALGEADGDPYLDQLAVRRAAMRQGIGRSLLRHARDAARRAGGRRLWLTTYAHLPFNRPFYEAEGFSVVPERDCGPQLRHHLEEQRIWLPCPADRVAMCCPL